MAIASMIFPPGELRTKAVAQRTAKPTSPSREPLRNSTTSIKISPPPSSVLRNTPVRAPAASSQTIGIPSNSLIAIVLELAKVVCSTTRRSSTISPLKFTSNAPAPEAKPTTYRL